MIENMVSIVEHDPDFAKVYVKEKAALLSVLTKVMTTKVWFVAMGLVTRYNTEGREAVLAFWEPLEEEIFGDVPNIKRRSQE